MTSRILGVVREQVLASLFGASDAMDAYNVAFRIPNLLRDLFAEGAMSAAFVPTFTRQLADRRQGRRRGGSATTSSTRCSSSPACWSLLGIVFAEPLVTLFAGRATRDVPGKLELTVQLTRIMLPFLTFVAAGRGVHGDAELAAPLLHPGAVAGDVQRGDDRLRVRARAADAAARACQPIAAIAIGTLLGGVAQLALQWPLLRREGFRYRPTLDWRDEGLRRVLLLMGPGTIGLAATQVNVFVNTLLATGEGTGAVSWLNYAFRLMYLPIGLFGVSIATATLPAVVAARRAARTRRRCATRSPTACR